MDPVFEARVKTLHEELIRKGLSANDAAAAAFTQAMAERGAGSVPQSGGNIMMKDGGLGGAATGIMMASDTSSSTSPSSASSGEGGTPSRGEESAMVVEGLSLDGLRPLLLAAHMSGNWSEVISYLQGFEISEILNASFPLPSGVQHPEGSLDLNMEAVAEFYRLVREADEPYRVATREMEGLTGGVLKAAQLKLCKALSEDPLPGLQADSEVSPSLIKQFLILLENPDHIEPPFYEVTGALLVAIKNLPDKAKDLVRNWLLSTDSQRFHRLLGVVQQYVSIRCVEQSFEEVRTGVRMMAIFFKANIKQRKVGIEAFYNDAINDELESEDLHARLTVSDEYNRWRQDLRAIRQNRGGSGSTRRYEVRSVICYPFVLDPSVKSRILNMDAVDQMRAEIEDEMQFALAGGHQTIRPYLILQVRREHIILDTMNKLALYESYDFKKPLKVQFIGEEGIDEGGVQKEYFQVLFRQMLTPDYGMFRHEEETGLLWFIPDSQSPPEEFELIGILLGIAIYNSVILDMRFPMVVYKKVMNAPLSLDDLKPFMPSVATSLENLLKYDGDVADAGLTFQVTYTPTYSEPEMVDLKPGGGEIGVTNENVKEYVDLYVDWLLNRSVAPHFDAFRKGFVKVCGGDALKLFQPEELELLICGNPLLDFEALERVTHYEDGVEKDSPLIRNFWSVVHQLNPEEKRLFLKFATGSDRAPINGLAHMNFVISRNGDDGDRLPTAHTCFNHLLLPNYSTIEKLRDRLKLAITQSEGFGLR